MSEYEFIKYEDTQSDQFTKALITIRQNLYTKEGRHKSNLLVFGKKEMKNGGTFWAMATHGVNQGEKKYYKGFRCDSTGDQELLDAFILQCAAGKGMASPSAFEKPTSMSEVAEVQEELPF